jgi:hypothetical protein
VKQPPTEKDLEDPNLRFNHIFLKDVVILTGNERFKTPPWVGRIESVDGFSLGNIL